MKDTFTSVDEIRRIGLGHGAEELAVAMYDRIIGELEGLRPGDWDAVTVCSPWTVTDIVRHLVGAAKGHASALQFARQALYGARHKKAHDGNDMDAMNALQVADHASLTADDLVEELRAVARPAVRRRMKKRRLTGRLRLPNAPGGSTAAGMPESLRLDHLMQVILTRDVFLHRIDIARATGRSIDVGEAEGRLVADVVAEWAERHGAPFRLSLSGPAGGRYATGSNGEEIDIDALEFCWVLSGRAGSVDPLLGTRVLF